ncbi:C40 family peptidase [Streptomyces sp. NPDC059224]|uniref:C40 family peptidase n=1 Tax=Streptomyces sp. NPDC059224 TaxID=3346775 RepID=UPI0036CEDCEE
MAPESRDEVRQRIDSLYDQAENATGNYNATRAMNGGSRSRGVPLFKRPRRDDPGLDSIAREWFDGARSRLGPSVPAALPSDRQPARPGPRRPVSAMAADLLGQLEGTGAARPELTAGPSANSDIEVVREPAGRPLELTAGSPAALPPGPSSSPKALPAAAPQRATPGASKTKYQLKIAKARELLSQRTGQRAIAAPEPAAPVPAPAPAPQAAQAPWPAPEAQAPAQQWSAPAGMPERYGDTGSSRAPTVTETTGGIPVVSATDTGTFRIMTPGAVQSRFPANTDGSRVMTPGATDGFPPVTGGETGAMPAAGAGDTGSFRVMTPGATGTFRMPDDTGGFPSVPPAHTDAFQAAYPADTGAFQTPAPVPGPMDNGFFPGVAQDAAAAYLSTPAATAEAAYPAAAYAASAPDAAAPAMPTAGFPTAAVPTAGFGTGAFPAAPAVDLGGYPAGTQPTAAGWGSAAPMLTPQAPLPAPVIPAAVTDPPWAMLAAPAAMAEPPLAMAAAAQVAQAPFPTATVPAVPPVVTAPVPTAPPVVTAPLPTSPPAAFAPAAVADTGSFLVPGAVAEPGKAMRALAFARAQIGRPCVWGATGPDSYDCSSLTQAAWRAAGVSLPRATAEQAFAGTPLTLAAIEPGDLVFFFDNDSHVGVYTGDGMMIHAPSPGASIREESIYNAGESAIHRVVRPA